ncbi:plasmid mobilization relaxosome protein MobC [Rhizobium gallicum]|uniref:plasmid mobilization relaxosome protein MobC n=1 Tax=Rhizobium gallicum TaxID=56730 RepID=UPI000A614AA6|nr:plasmid mobilization relaxosome protein MobC [Rhizobium gallicum]
MSLTTAFSSAVKFERYPTENKRPSPFSLRLSATERANLLEMAAGESLGAFIKRRLFGDSKPRRSKRSGISVKDHETLARVLALLGRSRLANNLNQLAHAVNIGALPLTPETEEELRAALPQERQHSAAEGGTRDRRPPARSAM